MIKKLYQHSMKVLVSLIVISLFLTTISVVSANSKQDTLSLKKQLVERAIKPTITDEKEKDKFADKISNEFQDIFAAYGYDQDKIDKFFESNGYIKLDVKKAAISGVGSLFTSAAYASSAGNVSMTSPSIYYNTSTARWTAVGGGSWNNYAWQYDRKKIAGVYTNGNMGGVDVAGMHFSNLKTSGELQAAVTKQELYTRPIGGTSTVKSTSRMNASSEYGVFFQYQDNTYNDGSTTNYNMDGFAVLLEFNSTFENVNGVASTGYEHTWNNTGVASLTLSNNSWSITPTGDLNYAWPAYSTDTAY